MSNIWKTFIYGVFGSTVVLVGAVLILFTIIAAIETCALYTPWLGVLIFFLVPVWYGLITVALDKLVDFTTN
jgi:hypothetical protein